jgi:ribosomal protein S14
LRYELKKFLLKSLIRNQKIRVQYKYRIVFDRNQYPRYANVNQFVNRCHDTGRARSVNRKTRYARFKFRTESYQGNLPGFTRAS